MFKWPLVQALCGCSLSPFLFTGASNGSGGIKRPCGHQRGTLYERPSSRARAVSTCSARAVINRLTLLALCVCSVLTVNGRLCSQQANNQTGLSFSALYLVLCPLSLPFSLPPSSPLPLVHCVCVSQSLCLSLFLNPLSLPFDCLLSQSLFPFLCFYLSLVRLSVSIYLSVSVSLCLSLSFSVSLSVCLSLSIYIYCIT